MLVDDHPVFLVALRDLVAAQSDMTVVGQAGDADGAIASIAQTKPDVAVLDLSLPVVSGLDLLAKIREISPETKVFILTGHRSEDYAGAALRAGATGFGTKSEQPDIILQAIRTVSRGEVHVSSIKRARPTPSPSAPPNTPDAFDRLTARERSVFTLAVCGLSNLEMAHRLSISDKTVETHRASVNRKLGVHSPAELTRYAALSSSVRRAPP